MSEKLVTPDEISQIQFSAVFDRETLNRMEENAPEINRVRNINRRASLLFLTLSRDEILEKTKDENMADAFIQYLESTKCSIDSIKAELEVMETASCRVLAVLSAVYPAD